MILCVARFKTAEPSFFVVIDFSRNVRILTAYNHFLAQMFTCLINKVKFFINVFTSLITRVQ